MIERPDFDDWILDEALAWHQALERDDADWDAYTHWLEADPLHRQAFDEIALTQHIVDVHLNDLQSRRSIAPEPAKPAVHMRQRWLYGAVAAALALAIGLPTFWPRQEQDIVYATARGESRQIALSQGITVDLAPSTRLMAKNGDPTRLELVQGDAYFKVAHDPRRTLSIQAGDYSVQDIGTAFSLNLSSDAVAVAVAEGHLSVAPGNGQATMVSAGEQFIARRSAQSARVTPVQPVDVASWRQGRLVYNDTPLSIVVPDIERYSGKAITVDPAIGDRPFSGVLVIGDGSRLLANLSDLMAISYEEKGDRVRLGAAPVR